MPASCGLTRDLDCHDSHESIDGVRAVEGDGLEMIDANTGILEQPRDVVDRGMVCVSVEGRLARVRARVCEVGGGNDSRL